MSSSQVRWDYDQLLEIVQAFQQAAETVRAVSNTLKQRMEVLQHGDWSGEGAQAFYAEMNSKVLPTYARLIHSLDESSRTLQQVIRLCEETEQVTSRLLQRMDHANTEILMSLFGAGADSGSVAGTMGAAAGGGSATGNATPASGRGTTSSAVKAPATKAVEPSLGFGSGANQGTVSEYTRGVVRDILRNAGLSSATITSTTRSPADQARVMYENIEMHGVAAQKKLYGQAGDQVIDVYVASKKQNKGKADIIQDMTSKINELGPTSVSKHAADPKKLNVVDIAPSSIKDRAAFEKAVAADKRVSVFLKPPNDPAYHIEIKQP